jgi:hypothetical protein
MPKKSAKQIVEKVVSKVKEEAPKVKAKSAPKTETPKVEHLRQCMVNVAPGSACNCPASKA